MGPRPLSPNNARIASEPYQIATLLRTFGVGPDRVAAAAILFTRAADSEREPMLAAIEAALEERDAAAWRRALGWYQGLAFSHPTGGRRRAPFWQAAGRERRWLLRGRGGLGSLAASRASVG